MLQDAGESHQAFILDEPPFPVAAVRLLVRVAKVHSQTPTVRQPVDESRGVAEIEANVAQRAVAERDQRLGDRIDEGIRANKSDLRMGLCLRDQMLGAAKSDFEARFADGSCKQRAKIERC